MIELGCTDPGRQMSSCASVSQASTHRPVLVVVIVVAAACARPPLGGRQPRRGRALHKTKGGVQGDIHGQEQQRPAAPSSFQMHPHKSAPSAPNCACMSAAKAAA